MYLVYLDESGSPYVDYRSFQTNCEERVTPGAGVPMPPYPFFVLAAVGIQESHLPMVDEWFAALKRGFLQDVSAIARQEYEIKGEILYALREKREPASWRGTRRKKRRELAAVQKAIWKSLTDSSLLELERSIFGLLRRLSPVIWAVVVKQRHIFRKHREKTWSPYYWALTYLQQRVSHHVQAVHGAYQRALFIMDETSTLNTAAQFDSYLDTRQAINSTAPWPVEFSRYLVDIPVSGQSHLHQALQISDLVAHAVMRHIRNQDRLGWFGQVEPLLAQHWNGQGYRNAGLTFIQ